MSSRRDLDALLVAVAGREIAPSEAAKRLGTLPFRDLGFARVDTHRELRQGAPEAIMGEGKTPSAGGWYRAGIGRSRRVERARNPRRRPDA